MCSTDPNHIVRERMSFFEHLCKEEVRSFTLRRVRPSSTTSLPQSSSLPPPKPKRTFMHTSFTPPSEVQKRNGGHLSDEKSFSSTNPTMSNTYDVPIIETARSNLFAPKHEPVAYYASVPIERAASASADLPTTLSPDASASIPSPCKLSRTPGFKAKLRTPKGRRSGDCSREADEEIVTKSLQKQKARARHFRRRTLEERDKYMAAMCGNSPQLFESVLIVSLEPESCGDGEKKTRKPTITYRFPEDKNAEHVPAELFFPDYSRAQRKTWAREEFVLALTDHSGARKNAYCHKFLPSWDENKNGTYPAVLVVISPIRNAVFYLDLARTILKYIGRSRSQLTGFLSSIIQHSYPQNRGASLVVVEKCATGWPIRIEIFNQGTILGRTGCSQVIERITPEITTCIVAALLGEQRILLADNTVCSVSKLVQVMEALIQPLSWPHVFIPAVPDNLLDLCHNPTPYLMGILRNNLAPIHDLIVPDPAGENDLDQVDFVFIDADNGLINPPPDPYINDSCIAAWKQQCAVHFCQRLGMPKKASMALMTGLGNALAGGAGSAADLRVENFMLVWYTSLFGHYKTIAAQHEWGAEFKQRLVDTQPDKSIRPYLSYLCETVMFHEWVVKRVSKSPDPSDPLPGSEEFLNRRIDKLYQAGVNCFVTKPLAKMFTKVTNALRVKK